MAVVIIGAAPDIEVGVLGANVVANGPRAPRNRQSREVGKLAVRPSTGALDSANFAANHRLRGLGGLWFTIWDLRWIKPEVGRRLSGLGGIYANLSSHSAADWAVVA